MITSHKACHDCSAGPQHAEQQLGLLTCSNLFQQAGSPQMHGACGCCKPHQTQALIEGWLVAAEAQPGVDPKQEPGAAVTPRAEPSPAPAVNQSDPIYQAMLAASKAQPLRQPATVSPLPV